MHGVSRRSCLRHWIQWCAVGPFTLPLIGCGTPAAAPPAAAAKELSLPYRSTAEFAAELGQALSAGQTVTVVFDGQDRITEGAPLLQFLSDRQQLQNHEEFWKTLDALDHPEGRALLAQAFAEPLLDHQAVTRVEGEHTRSNGQVVGPGTVLMVLIIGLICSFTIVATTQIVVHGPILAEWGVDPLTKGPRMRMRMRMWPAQPR